MRLAIGALRVTVVLLLALAGPAAAQERSLAWPEIRVTAHLDADGRLHVTERAGTTSARS